MKLRNTMFIAALLAASCSQETVPARQDCKEFTGLTADGTITRTSLEEDGSGYAVLWSAGDRINVNGMASEPLSEENSGSRQCTFTVKGELTSPYTAVYPAESYISGNQILIPSVQTPAESGFDPMAALMAVRSEDEQLQFHHLCGYLKLQIEYPEGCERRASEVRFRGKNSEKISGNFSLEYDAEGNPRIIGSAEDANGTTQISSATGLSSFLIALPPVDFSTGFELEIGDARGIFLKADTDNSVSIRQGVIVKAPKLRFSYAEGDIPDLSEDESGTEPVIVWGSKVLISGWCSTYGRVHRLNDGRLMACYSNTWNAKARFSSDNGTSWGAESVVARYSTVSEGVSSRMDNPEFAQLSASNPYKPGRIIYTVNERVNEAYKESEDGPTLYRPVYPYHISYCVSDDNGQTWSGLKRLYSSSSVKGCYEPFVLELPDGKVQIYFADESPYYGYQNISVIESSDGGETWGSTRIVCYSPALRDGMPTALVYGNNIYLAIEYMGSSSERFHPQVIYDSLDSNWSSITYKYSDRRFFPFRTSLASNTVYNGAPYLIQTENYFVISYQSTKGSAGNSDTNHAVMEVQLCPKSEMDGNIFTTMRSASRPVNIDQSTGCGKWNSLCPLGNDEILAITSTGGTGHESSAGFLYAVKGKITTRSLNFE